MKKILEIIMGIALVMALAACGGGSNTNTNKTSDNTASAGDAQKIVTQKCFVCHGDNLKGNIGPNLQHIGSKYSKAQILDILKNGKAGGMPSGVISGADANTVATWLASKK